MRDGLLREREPLGDEAAHGVVRHDLVGAGIVEREHLLVREAARRLSASAPDQLAAAARARGFDRDRPRRLPSATRFGAHGLARGALDVGLDDAAMRARAVERCELEPELARESPREGEAKMRLA